jgi:hypothetical protein
MPMMQQVAWYPLFFMHTRRNMANRLSGLNPFRDIARIIPVA